MSRRAPPDRSAFSRSPTRSRFTLARGRVPVARSARSPRARERQSDGHILDRKIAGLRASMQRFDAARGNPVANTPAIEQRPLGHENTDETRKEQLH
jgi:hypothetical protein